MELSKFHSVRGKPKGNCAECNAVDPEAEKYKNVCRFSNLPE